MPKLIRITTVPVSLKTLLKGQSRFMCENGFEVIGVSSNGEELLDVHTDEGIRVVPLEMTRIISPFKDLVSLWKFYRLCRRERPVIVHSHTPKAGLIGMLGAKMAGVPIRLHTVAGMPLMETSGLKRKILDIVEKLTYAAATCVYPNSKKLYKFIVNERYARPAKLKVIANGSSNGINSSFFSRVKITDEVVHSLRRELGISAEDFVFIFVGRLVGDKGINELIEAFQQIKGKFVKLLLVGALESKLDPLKPESISAIDSNPNIISAGFQKDVRPFFAVANVLVFPSYREGFPNVVMQAGAMELPAIVSNINGCNEIIVEGENGIIVPVKNVDAIQKAMDIMLINTELYLKMKENSRKMITDRYEQQVVWEALLDEYKRLLKEKGLNNV